MFSAGTAAMALIACYECGQQISDLAAACPGCGAPAVGSSSAAKLTSNSNAALPVDKTQSEPNKVEQKQSETSWAEWDTASRLASGPYVSPASGETRIELPKSFEEPASPEAASASTDQTSLAKAYWIYGVLGNSLFGIAAAIASGNFSQPFPLLIVSGGFIYAVGTATQIWAAANRYDGPRIWSVLAKAAVVFGMLVNVLLAAALLMLAAQNRSAFNQTIEPGPNTATPAVAATAVGEAAQQQAVADVDAGEAAQQQAVALAAPAPAGAQTKIVAQTQHAAISAEAPKPVKSSPAPRRNTARQDECTAAYVRDISSIPAEASVGEASILNDEAQAEYGRCQTR